jgi:hypothetical protein
MIIKKFKIFEGSKSITNIEVKDIIDDVLVDLTDLNDNFFWDCYIPSDDNFFESCNLRIKCRDDVSKNTEWVEILERLFYILSGEGIKILEKKESSADTPPYIDVKPKINLGWTLKARRNPMNFQVDSTWWEKEFVFLA